MSAHRTRGARAVAATVAASLALIGAVFTASPASATGPTPVVTLPTASGTAPGLFIHVIDGAIIVKNQGGSNVGFTAGQFGFVPTYLAPPVGVPQNPGLIFTPPPVFQTPAAQLAAQQAAQPAVDASAQAKADSASASMAQVAAELAAKAAAERAEDEASALAAVGAAVQAKSDADYAVGFAREVAWHAQEAADRAIAEGWESAPELVERAAQLAAEVVAAEEAQDAAWAVQMNAESAYSQAGARRSEADQALADATVAAQNAMRAAQAALQAELELAATSVAAIPRTVPAFATPPTVAPQPVPAGQNMLVAAAGFRPGTQVTFGMFSDPISVAPVAVNAAGVAEAAFAVPAGFTGAHSLVASGIGTDGLLRTLRMDISVSTPAAVDPATPVVTTPVVTTPVTPAAPAPAAAKPTTELAATGTATAPQLWTAAALLSGGIVLLLIRRRRSVA